MHCNTFFIDDIVCTALSLSLICCKLNVILIKFSLLYLVVSMKVFSGYVILLCILFFIMHTRGY